MEPQNLIDQPEEGLRLLRRVYENIREGVMITDTESKILSINPAFTDITGYAAHEALGNTPRILRSDKHGKTFYASLWETLLREGSWQGEIWNRRKNGETYAQWLNISALKNDKGVPTHYVGVFDDLTGLKLRDEQLRYHALNDTLTGLPNRVQFKNRLEWSLKKTARNDSMLAVMILDLDNFKTINSSLGHIVGDRLLREAGGRLQGTLSEINTVARLGNDEFAVIIEHLRGHDEALGTANKLLKALAAPFNIDGQEIYLTANIGVSISPADSKEPETLMRYADLAMCRAKKRGKNRIEHYSPGMNAAARKRLLLEHDLHAALRNGEFTVHYQPKFDLKAGRVTGMEALLRWEHPKNGRVPPASFIPSAEETGLIIPIGRWILEEACRQNKAWQKAGHPGLRVAVNISAVQFRNQNLVEVVASVLKKTGLSPDCLTLEITESAVMQNVEAAVGTMKRLSAMGIRLSIDDFGTGHSSLSYLKRFPLHELKIDKSFITDVATSRGDATIAEAIIALSHGLKLNVVAEGVENSRQVEFLRERGCDEMQGFLLAPPMPAEAFSKFLGAQTEPALQLDCRSEGGEPHGY